METATLETIAREAYDALEWCKRDDGSEYVARKDNAPEWVQDLCYAAHGDMMPDDWRFRCIYSALGSIADDGYDEDGDNAHLFADSHVDIYTTTLTVWLGSHGSRPGYVDEAAEDFGQADGITQAIQRGQYAEAIEVYNLVADALRERLDEDGDA